MNYIVTGQEMKSCDRATIEHFKVPSLVLMERAALACADFLFEKEIDCGCTGILCGAGNNGGDGLAIARILKERDKQVFIFFVGKEEKASKETAAQLAMVRQYQIPVYGADKIDLLSECTLIVDALFGIGLSRELSGEYVKIMEGVNALPSYTHRGNEKANEKRIYKLAVDIPSGIQADTGQVLGAAFCADATVTFAYAKAGLLLYPGAQYAGEVVVKDIGITNASFQGQVPQLFTYTTDEIQKMLPKRPADSNKGSFGKAVLAVGSKGMAGAAYLAGLGAYRTGCGLVRIVTSEENRMIIQQRLPEAVLTTYDSEQIDRLAIMKALSWGTVTGIGCGLGQGEGAKRLLQLLLKEVKTPLLLDGDALNILSGHMEWLENHQQPIVVTPHLLEMSRMTKQPVEQIKAQIVKTAREFAKRYRVCCVLKDTRTIVAATEGLAYINLTGNSGMAVGGSGDVLAGMICSFMAQGLPVEKAAVLGVHLHGCAGDHAAKEKGEYGMLASDLAQSIPFVMRSDYNGAV